MRLLGRKVLCSLASAVMLSVALNACGTAPATPIEHKGDPAADISGKVQSLNRQIRERDKRIEELESQLDTLRLIEQDLEKQRRPVRPPATLEPMR
jgi:hypothetical protein